MSSWGRNRAALLAVIAAILSAFAYSAFIDLM
jgi:hypothetical protein